MRSERWTENPEDEGSTPSWPTKRKTVTAKSCLQVRILCSLQWRIGAMVDAID